ncbi:uncharacterized protein LOC141674003 [Apium graveolens]|uniref:uncharacterized protein LOC141674003 n=1 Tax=Apium graveolens TaxID=4045 RepID=UPI003D7A6022
MGKLSFDKCLCNLRASINPMPLSVFMQLALPDPKPTNISLQLADRSITYPRGIVEDVLVKVDKLIFTVDFVILDFKKDKKIPIILGRTFLATGRTLIDVQKEELIMRKFPTDEEECYKVELVDSIVNLEMEQLLRSYTLERALTGEFDIEDEGAEQLQLLNASPWKRKLDIPFESLGIVELKNSQEVLKPSIKEAPTLELKPLSAHLRLPGHEYYCLLDRYSGYNQICISPEDQEKTTFTCPFGTFAFRRDVPFKFDQECLASFEILKKKLTTTPFITAPNWGEPFEMMCDASDFAVGAVLGQRKKNIFHVIYYASKTLNDAQLNYTTTEKELLAVVYGFEKFRSYLLGTKEFELEIKDKKGTENQVADHLSRLEDHAYGGHYGGEKTAARIFQEGFFLPTLFNDAHQFVLRCDHCQQVENMSKRDEMPLNVLPKVDIFYVWGIDFMGPFISSCNNQYILLEVD